MNPFPETDSELGSILGGVVRGVVEAQQALDAYAQTGRERALVTPVGSVVVPPLWYTFTNVAVEMELSASLQEVGTKTRLSCRTLSPAMLSLYGRQAAANIRVRVQIAPQGLLPLQKTTETPKT